MRKIVVGIDGSEDSRRALRWALDEARLRGAEVHAVHAWAYPVMAGSFEAIAPMLNDLDLGAEAANSLERDIKEVTAGDETVKIHREVKQGPAASALLQSSRDADLLVVGSRGLGGFRGLLLGSVGQQCAQHARCPVVIVPRDE